MANNLKRDEPCPHCGRFDNRGITIDAVIIKENKVLLVQRSDELYKGFWATPSGFVEWDKSAEDAVKREVKEETNLNVTATTLVCVRSLPERHIKQAISVVYIAKVESGEPQAGDDAQAVRWFPINETPEQLAFDHSQSVNDALKLLAKQTSNEATKL